MIDQLIHRIKVREAELKEALVSGSVSSWDVYQRIVGQHQGLEEVLVMIDNMLEEEKS